MPGPNIFHLPSELAQGDVNGTSAHLIEKAVEKRQSQIGKRSNFVVYSLIAAFILLWIVINVFLPIKLLKTTKAMKSSMHQMKRQHYDNLHDDKHYCKMAHNFHEMEKFAKISTYLTLFFALVAFLTFEYKLRR